MFSNRQRENWAATIAGHHRWNISYGATRSGKTYLDYYKIPQRIRAASNEGLILMLGNTKGTLERNILDPMRAIWGNRMVGTIGGSSNRIKLFGREVYALGADKVTSVTKIQGSGLSYCYGDEITTWVQPVFEMLKSRLDKPGAVFDGTCNPDNPKHWLHEFMGTDADICATRFVIDDNPFNPPDFVRELKKEYAGTVYYDRFINGLWVAAEGVIYRQFADCPARYIIDAVPVVGTGMHTRSDVAFCMIGVDFGGTGSAQAFQCTGISADFKRVYTLDEFYTKDPLTPAQLDAAFVEFCRAQICKGYKILGTWADNAESLLMRGLQAAVLKAGLPIKVSGAKKGPINDRIRFYTMLQGCDRYRVLRHCIHTIDAFSTVTWNPKVLGDSRLDDGTYNIDTLDAQEYSTEPYQEQILRMMLIGG